MPVRGNIDIFLIRSIVFFPVFMYVNLAIYIFFFLHFKILSKFLILLINALDYVIYLIYNIVYGLLVSMFAFIWGTVTI